MTREPDSLAAVLEHALAQRDALAQSLLQMVAIVDKVGGYMEHDRQAQLRHARALLVEVEEVAR